MGRKNRSYDENQNSIWNRWLGEFLLFVIFGTSSLIVGLILERKGLYEIGINHRYLQSEARTSWYYFLIAALFYIMAFFIWRKRKKKNIIN